jgi:integral membrane protein (TIGR01906 family)
MKVVRILFFLLIPLIVFLASLRMSAFDEEIYSTQFAGEKFYQENPEAKSLAFGILHYIKTGQSMDSPYFNENELVHLKDVREIIRLCFIVLMASAVILGLCILILLVKKDINELLASVQAGGISSLVIVFVLGVVSVISFDALFVKLHEVMFNNNLWLMNPRTDIVINLFPQGLFVAIWKRIMLYSSVSSLVLVLAPFAVRRLRKE